MAEIITTGKTVDEAVEEGCRQLGVSRDEISIEVLEMPQKILFFSKPAKVKITQKRDEFSVHDLLYGDDHKPEKKKAEKKEQKEQNNKKQNPKQKNKDVKQNQPKEEKKEEKKKSDKAEIKTENAPKEQKKDQKKDQKKEQKSGKKERKNTAKEAKKQQKPEEKKQAIVTVLDEPEDIEEDLTEEVILETIQENELPGRAVKALTFLKEIVSAYGAKEVEYSFARTARGVCIQIGGEDAPMLIGKRGELMDAIQYLCTVGSSRDGGDYCRVSLDIEGYRARREKALRGVAAKTASKVLRVRRSQALEPMNPYERAIVHSEVQKIKGVSSHSVGSEPRRKVVITLEGEGGEERKRSRRGRSGKVGGERRSSEQTPSVPKVRMSDIPVKKELKSTEEFIGNLYGKIEL